MLTAKAMSIASLRPSTGVAAVRRNQILLSTSVEFLMGLGNSAASVLSCAVPYPIVIWCLRLVAICHVCTFAFEKSVTTMVTILSLTVGGGILDGRGAGVGEGLVAGRVGMCVDLSACATFSCWCCLRVCLSAAAAATTVSKISGRGVVVAGRVYVGAAFATTVLQISRVSSSTLTLIIAGLWLGGSKKCTEGKTS